MNIHPNSFKKLNQTMIEIVESVFEKEGRLSMAAIMAELFRGRNKVTVLFEEMQLSTKEIAIDFASKSSNSKFTLNVDRVFQRIQGFESLYIDEIEFLLATIRSEQRNGIAKTVLSGYIDIKTLEQYLINIVSPTPNQNWEAGAETILDQYSRNISKLALDGEIDPALNRDAEMQRMIQILIRKTKSNPILIGKAGTGKTAIVEGLAHILNNGNGVPISLIDAKIYQLDMAAILTAGGQPGALEKILDDIIKEAKIQNAILFIDEVHIIMANGGRIANALKPAMARGDVKLIGATTDKEFKDFEKDEAMMRRWQPVKINEPDKTSIYTILQQKAQSMEKFHNVIVPNITLLRAIRLSEKYITWRNQPDAAIDLIEASAAKLRMALESKPDALVNLQDKIGELQIEIEMQKVQAEASGSISEKEADKLEEMHEKLAKLNQEFSELNAKYIKQRALIDSLIDQKAKLIEARDAEETELYEGNFEKVVSIRNELIPSIEKNILAIEQEMLDKASENDLVRNIVQPEMIGQVIEEWTGIPASAQDQDELIKFKNMEEILKREVHGQDTAIEKISSAIKRSKAGLSEASKPLGSFLCLGPTGVGKTYLAQKLAEFLFDTDKVLVRFDMSEYMEPHSVSRLIGSPPGYVGYGEGGQLTEAIKRNPYSVILFDEIEKAHPRIFDALLQVLDAGRLTDGQGQTIDFKNTVIIMTSNIGASIIQQGIANGIPSDELMHQLESELQSNFRPEFLNRFDSKIMFNSLSIENTVKISESELNKFKEKLYVENDINIVWNPKVPSGIALSAYDPMNGARPIKRFINDKIISQLTELILSGDLNKDGHVYLDMIEKDFVLTPVTVEDIKDIAKDNQVEVELIAKEAICKANKKAKKALKKAKKNKKQKETFPETESGDGE